MGRNKELSTEQRGQIIGAYLCGTKPATIARTLGFAPSTVYATISRYKRTGSAQSRPHPGRPKSLNNRDQRVVRRAVLKGRHKTLAEITNEVNASLNMTLCQDTVRKYIAEWGFSSRVPCEKPFLKKNMSKPGSSGAGSTKRGTKNGGRWSSPTSRASASSTTTGEEGCSAESESDIAPSA